MVTVSQDTIRRGVIVFLAFERPSIRDTAVMKGDTYYILLLLGKTIMMVTL